MKSIMTERMIDEPPRMYPLLKQCKSDSHLIVLFVSRDVGMIVHKWDEGDDRPLFVMSSDWDENQFDIYDDAVILQND